MNSTAWPPGRICGQRCVASPFSAGFVTACGGPPALGTRERPMPVLLSSVAMILSSSPQAAPRASGASHKVITALPRTETFFIFLPAKKPIHWPSGLKNGSAAPSVPESSVACG